MGSMVAQRLTQITPPVATPDQLWQRVEAAWSAVPQEHIQSLFERMPRRVAAIRISDYESCTCAVIAVVVVVSFPKGMNRSCQSLRPVGLQHDTWRHHLSPHHQFRHGTG
ncbi:transposable element Tcb1 transposase, partial [Trichonephila clavipes]